MSANGFIQVAFYCVVVTLLVKPFGYYMTRVFNGERTFLSLPLRPLEWAIYALSGVKEDEEQDWKSYGLAMLTFSLAGFLALYALQRLQALLPFNPQHLDAISPDLAFNTWMSFVTNANWQSYVPETTMSYLTQMASGSI
jgi:potassium-transporting ATPase potassium-binding subunit